MSSFNNDQSARTITVNPAARRCGVDNQGEVEVKNEQNIESVVSGLADTKEFIAVSDRLLKFAELADREVSQLQSAAKTQDYQLLESSVQRLTDLATDVGASDLIRVGYQMLISIRQGEHAKAIELTESVTAAYSALRDSLRLG